MSKKQVILAAHYPGVNNTTVWNDPASGSQIDFSSFEHLARTAERGKLDFVFLAEGLRLREQGGRIHDLDVVGRPDTLSVLTALAAVTTNLGLGATLNTTFHEPYELARQLAALDHLSDGRALWNIVTSSDAFTGENFRRGGFLDRDLRYERAREFLEVARTLWESWDDDDLVADPASGQFLRRADAGSFEHRGDQFDIRGRYNVPRSPQVHPVVLQAGDSDGGRELAAETADGVFTRHSSMRAAKAFYADVKGRLAKYGRSPDELKILPGATFALGDDHDDAVERARAIRFQQVSPATAIRTLEQVWNRDLSAYDADGPLPEIEPDVDSPSMVQGRAMRYDDRMATAKRWREIAEAKGGLSIRELVIETTGRQSFIGSPAEVAEQLDTFVQEDACDGFILVPHLTPGGFDRFVDEVVPVLQERGVLRAEYEHATLRENMGLAPLPRQSDAATASA